MLLWPQTSIFCGPTIISIVTSYCKYLCSYTYFIFCNNRREQKAHELFRKYLHRQQTKTYPFTYRKFRAAEKSQAIAFIFIYTITYAAYKQ